MTQDPAHKPRDPRAARRALLADLEALREALDGAHDTDADADVPVLDDVIGEAPAPNEAHEAPEPAEDWRADADRLVDEARQRIADLRIEAARGAPRESDARERARLLGELSVWLRDRIDAELADLRLRLTSEMEAELARAVEAIFNRPERP